MTQSTSPPSPPTGSCSLLIQPASFISATARDTATRTPYIGRSADQTDSRAAGHSSPTTPDTLDTRNPVTQSTWRRRARRAGLRTPARRRRARPARPKPPRKSRRQLKQTRRLLRRPSGTRERRALPKSKPSLPPRSPPTTTDTVFFSLLFFLSPLFFFLGGLLPAGPPPSLATLRLLQPPAVETAAGQGAPMRGGRGVRLLCREQHSICSCTDATSPRNASSVFYTLYHLRLTGAAAWALPADLPTHRHPSLPNVLTLWYACGGGRCDEC